MAQATKMVVVEVEVVEVENELELVTPPRQWRRGALRAC